MRVFTIRSLLMDFSDFMNIATPGLTAKQWEKWCRMRPNWVKLEAGEPIRISHDEALAIRSQMHHDLTPLRSHYGNPFGVIVDRLNELELPIRWSLRWGKGQGDSFQKTMLAKGRNEKRWIVTSWPAPTRNKDVLYCILGEAIRQGEIRRLQNCLECASYFVAQDPRQVYCRELCRHRFNNKRKPVLQYRQFHRQQSLRTARRMKANGAGFEEVRTATGLPPRVLVEQLGFRPMDSRSRVKGT